MQYNQEQVLAMAPDDAAAKAGQQLANNARWLKKEIHPKALWGDCQGSGKTPYKTIIDLTNIAFKCSCPSRKFPCKHGLGLMLLFARQPELFTTAEVLPAHVAEWLGKREDKEAAKEEKEDKVEKIVDEAAKLKRVASREKKVEAGIAELRAWLCDVVRTGIMNVPQNAYQFSLSITARMVDAQAGGLANQLRQINNINFYKEGWQKTLIKRLSSIYLITEAYSNKEQLPPDMVQELQTLIGWTTGKEELLQAEPVTDVWTVLSITMTDEGNITTERIWLYGNESNRYALLLNFYAGRQMPQHLLVAGMQVSASLVYYPGVQNHRALIKEQTAVLQKPVNITAPERFMSVCQHITETLTRNPFAEQIPFLLAEVSLVREGNSWYIKDADNQGTEIANVADEQWKILAFTRGKAFSCFGIYENEQIQLHMLWNNGRTFFVK